MKDDFLKLAEYLDDLSKEVSQISSEASKRYVFELMKALIKFSPVDTSQLISNWVVNINAKPDGILQAHHKGVRGSTSELSGSKSLFDAINEIKKIKSGNRIYVSNVAPQVVYTNYGTTNQEPQYFIERAMQLAEKAVSTKDFDIKLDASQ